jgi:signal transduction histidine kinase
MSEPSGFWRDSDRVSLFLIALMLLLVLLLGGLILTDRSLTHSIDRQAAVDAATSATIVAQEVELTGEWLHELSTASHHRTGGRGLTSLSRTEGRSKQLEGVWLFDSLGTNALDSVLWDSAAVTRIPDSAVERLARRAAREQRLVLYGLPFRNHGGKGLALLAEPVVDSGVFANVAVAIVDEAALLAPAAAATVQGRAFLALVVNGDTVARATYGHEAGRRSTPVQIPLPGAPEWSLVTAQTFGGNTARWTIWLIGTVAVGLLFVALVRERAQTRRIAERSFELERLSAELLRANRMKSEFLASVSHELRTPLNAIVGFVDLLRDGAYGDLSAKQVSPVQRIAASTARLRLLVDQVLDMAKIAAGRLDVRFESVSLRPFLTNVLNEIEPLVDRNALTVSVTVGTEIPKIRTDPTHLRQILINLIGNAVKYTRMGSIDVRAHVERNKPDRRGLTVTGQHSIPHADQGKEWMVIEVADTGIGIPAMDQERIFEEFEQVRHTDLPEGRERGTGLGLPISRRLATLLGGDITVESEPGRGSVFSVWLPLWD